VERDVEGKLKEVEGRARQGEDLFRRSKTGV
jgi:hypothetical protein